MLIGSVYGYEFQIIITLRFVNGSWVRKPNGSHSIMTIITILIMAIGEIKITIDCSDVIIIILWQYARYYTYNLYYNDVRHDIIYRTRQVVARAINRGTSRRFDETLINTKCNRSIWRIQLGNNLYSILHYFQLKFAMILWIIIHSYYLFTWFFKFLSIIIMTLVTTIYEVILWIRKLFFKNFYLNLYYFANNLRDISIWI